MQGHTGLEPETEKPPGTPAAVFCLSWFCVASRLFLVLLFLGGGGGGLFFCRLVTLLLPAHSSSWLPHGFQVNIAYLSGQGKVINKWTPVSQWLNITKVYFFSHYSSSVGDRYTTISWCCRLSRWFQGCQQQSCCGVTSHCLGPEGPRATRLTSVCPDSHVVPPTAEGQGESYLTVQVTSWDQFTFPEPPTCISLIKSCSSNCTPGHVSGENS